MTLLQDVSNISSIIFDIIVLLPFFSRRVRRYLFKAVIIDIIYEILNDGKELENKIKLMRNVIHIYNEMKKEEIKQLQTEIKKEEKND